MQYHARHGAQLAATWKSLECPLLALRDGRHSDGQPSLSGHCGHGWTYGLPRPVARHWWPYTDHAGKVEVTAFLFKQKGAPVSGANLRKASRDICDAE
jgi:hypothetical protein